jgi:hypothetical protein
MGFEIPQNVQTEIPSAHRSKFFPDGQIKDSQCEEAASGWRDYFEGRAS